MEKIENICKFVPTTSAKNEINVLNFVCEKNWRNEKPHISASNTLYIVSAGSGRLTSCGFDGAVSMGDLFFTFPAKEYTLVNTDGLEFMYISYVGDRIASLYDRLGIKNTMPVYSGFPQLLPFWHESLERASHANIDLVAQSVLYHTFSYIPTDFSEETDAKQDKNVAIEIKKYVDDNYRQPNISLAFLSEKFGYNPSYISDRFKRTAYIGLSAYITRLRMEYAVALLKDGCVVISQISEACGYTDPLYFSKVFKKAFGCPPKEYGKISEG